MISRRSLIGGLTGTAVAWPVTVHARQSRLPVIGVLNGASPQGYRDLMDAFERGVAVTGYRGGKDVLLEYRWGEGRDERLPALAADLVARRVNIIAALGGPPPGLAAKVATATIPIVVLADDPVKAGLIASLNEPGGNVTGVGLFASTLFAKQFSLLHELLPKAGAIAILVNPTNPTVAPASRDIREAEQIYGQPVQILKATTDPELDTAFASLGKQRIDALIVSAGPSFTSRRDQIVGLAARHAIPAVFPWREYAVAGGMMSYGSSLLDAYRQAGIYAGRILKGENPAHLPVQLPTKFELVINLKTAKALGLNVPATLLARADEVIE